MADHAPDPQGAPRQRGWEGLKAHVVAYKVDVAMWLTRLFTVVFCFLYVLFGVKNAYYKALLSNAATSALRLHQRLPSGSLNREFIGKLMMEDSCHYLIYSLIFVYASPVMLVLVPVGFFAVIHAASYSLPLLDAIGQNSCWFARILISLVELQSRNILRVISFAEIFLMPYCIVLMFMGRVGLPTPFIYHQFLTMRYSSRRNPYTRNMFRELREWTEATAARPVVPAFVKTILLKSIEITCRLAPAPRPINQEHQQ